MRGLSQPIIISINIYLQIQTEEGIAFTELKEKFDGTVKTNNHFHQHLSLNTIGRSDYIYRVEGEI